MGEFDEIYGKHAAAVLRYALRCVGRRDVAEDIASEVFLALYLNMAVSRYHPVARMALRGREEQGRRLLAPCGR